MDLLIITYLDLITLLCFALDPVPLQLSSAKQSKGYFSQVRCQSQTFGIHLNHHICLAPTVRSDCFFRRSNHLLIGFINSVSFLLARVTDCVMMMKIGLKLQLRKLLELRL